MVSIGETRSDPAFPSTCWSRILGTGAEEEEAVGPDLDALAQAYWRPVYGYIRSYWSKSNEDAKDRTQEFFLWMLESDLVGRADPTRGRFRAFLKASLGNFLTGLDRKQKSHKRGGDRVHVPLHVGDGELPDLAVSDLGEKEPQQVLDTMWRAELVEHATESLERELDAQGKRVCFEVFRDYFLSAEDGLDYRTVAQRYGISTSTVSNYLAHAKKRYRAHLRAEVRKTVTDVHELEEELRWLFGAEDR